MSGKTPLPLPTEALVCFAVGIFAGIAIIGAGVGAGIGYFVGGNLIKYALGGATTTMIAIYHFKAH